MGLVCRDFLTQEEKKKIKVYIFALLVCVPVAGTGFCTSAEVGQRTEVADVPDAGSSSQAWRATAAVPV